MRMANGNSGYNGLFNMYATFDELSQSGPLL